MIKTLTEQTYEDVLRNNIMDHTKIAIVKVSAPWCGPCKLLKNHYEKWAEQHKDEEDVTFYEVDNDSNPNFLRQYEVNAIPSILFFVYGVETYSIRSMTRQKVFEEVLQKTREIKTERH